MSAKPGGSAANYSHLSRHNRCRPFRSLDTKLVVLVLPFWESVPVSNLRATPPRLSDRMDSHPIGGLYFLALHPTQCAHRPGERTNTPSAASGPTESAQVDAMDGTPDKPTRPTPLRGHKKRPPVSGRPFSQGMCQQAPGRTRTKLIRMTHSGKHHREGGLPGSRRAGRER